MTEWIICQPYPEPRRGRPPIDGKTRSPLEQKRAERKKQRAERLKYLAVLDMETDPFDNLSKTKIHPFTACLYSDQFDPIIIWNEDPETFVSELIAAIESLPGKFTIYAHNGGKFDFMFLVHRLRGFVSFKGRGIMAAKIGDHELRDSFHIIPEKLANWQKEEMDYKKMRKGQRNKYKKEIIDYLISDCVYLFEIVREFLKEFGFKLSVGQAAMAELRTHYKTKRLGENMDGFLRNYFFGGRVECLMGKGEFVGNYGLYDVNSMYPFVMSEYNHPIGNEFDIRSLGKINDHTSFIDLECINHGAFVRRGENNETSANCRKGRFRVTRWEYEVALKYGLIENVTINYMIDCRERTDFSKFVAPLYARRQEVKQQLKELRETVSEDAPVYKEAKKNDIFLKLIMNNAYGKFAQNPRRFKEHFITDPNNWPQEEGFGDLPEFESDTYWIWSRPLQKLRFNNVATAASITGAARAVLLEAIHNSVDPIYCDTDSLICRELNGVKIHGSELGAWDLEKALDHVLIAGKKLYAYKVSGVEDGQPGRIKVRSKGAAGLTWEDMQKILDDEIINKVNFAPTLTRTGGQYYVARNIRATVGRHTSLIAREGIRNENTIFASSKRASAIPRRAVGGARYNSA